jgi:hypothetical protein
MVIEDDVQMCGYANVQMKLYFSRYGSEEDTMSISKDKKDLHRK